ncbi:ATP synthase F1 subunit delta [Phycisphaera mikurensis]|uniref:ATP synthase subunit delta n=1 Tax=Phycisphaera mikurensis (strain NBRC 102666 / KCTC 22515 / FYK2301M01) TaxID=1142394 RepID=I0IAR9_PHYMF|nr:ATP synthase F1 subunit delta [Phycisphaera mikurensis]MBB6442667.1 F-type H+-transporting ATPase subunit delta [Phycisphaera mikurensis]BAM02357.1 ATP synthase subunit delta [Phycisphaera mikurensis NBRC 102666]
MPETSTQTNQVGRVYADALIELAQKHDRLDEVADEAQQLSDLLREQPRLQTLLSNPAITSADRVDLVERVFAGKVSDTLFKFLSVMARKDRLDELDAVLVSVRQRVADIRGEVEVDAWTAKEMGEDLRNDVRDRVASALGGKAVTLREHVDPSLLGGLKLRVGDRLVDGTAATRLRLLRRNLITAGKTAARDAAAVSGSAG